MTTKKRKPAKRKAAPKRSGRVIYKAPLNPSLREALDIIDGWLCRTDLSSQLANVLAAVRGPDTYNSSHVKDVTTIPIRRAAFPRLADCWDQSLVASNTGWDMTLHPFHLDDARLISDHFDRHIHWAASALRIG